MGNSLAKAAALDFGIQWGCWVIAAALKTEKFYDLTGSSTFLALALQSLRWGGTYHTRQKIQTGLVVIWAARLGTYLPGVFFVYWSLQGVWVFSTLLPTLLLNGKTDDVPLSLRDYVGWSLWGLGFLFETVADHQKSRFKADPQNTGKFINEGLWSISRHPNYFGEIVMWSGLYISASSVLSGWEHISVISPLLLSHLLINVSGIPMLEKYGQKRWGGDPAYQNYVRKTAKLIPFVW
ncbi:hypothetical protein ACOMHN_062443 [Nucella lapillus]